MKRGFWAFGFLLLLSAGAAHAHQYWPGYLQMHQIDADSYDVMWKVPASGELRLPLDVHLPAECRPSAPKTVSADGRSYVERWSVRCDGGLDGRTISISGLELVPTDALVRIERRDDTVQVARLTPAEPSVVAQKPAGWLEVAKSYLALGVEHILLGIDHLLFVLALLLITRGTWRLVKTVTAFTIAHSITLALATLGFVHVPSAPVEATIALSIVFVAAEIVRAQRGFEGITARAPWLVAFIFGLLHGFGFAGALSEVGLPQAHIPLALLFFNMGVEVGQLLFIAAVLASLALLRRVRFNVPRWAHALPAYAIGSVAMYWVFDRVTAF
jgi:hydrogenase/urease accessory protein HupE